MPQYSDQSRRHLETCIFPLRQVFQTVILEIDHTIIEGGRGRELQNEYFRTGRSRVRWPDGKHNEVPSEAVDAAPYPINWNDRERFVYFAGYVLGTAQALGYVLKWGGDWDQDHDLRDQNFMDLVHFEYVGEVDIG